jgi:UDP:flavonoid glycosyltransferase YjiC (YdhE family)
MAGPLGRLRNRFLTAVAQRVLFARLDDVHADVRAAVGLPAPTEHVMRNIGSPYLLLHPGVPSFEYPRSDLPDRVHFVGPMLPPLDETWHQPAWWGDLDGRTVVHVTQGTVSNHPTELLLPTLRGLAGSDVLVVATTGGPTAAELEALNGQPLPANARVAPFIPYRQLLSRAKIFVTNGGYSGVTMALAHGVPIVQAGVTEEKKEVGARVDWTGVGQVLRTSTPDSGQVRRAVLEVLSTPRYAAAAARVRDEMAAHDAPSEAADLLEGLAVQSSVRSAA